LLPISKDPLEELLLTLLGGYLLWELLNPYLRISMKKFSRSSFYPTPLINFLGHSIEICLLKRLATPYLLRRLAASYLLRRLAASYLLRRLAASYLLMGLVASYLLRRLTAPYLLRRRYSLVIASRPEVAFVTPSIPVDRSNMEWFCLRNIRS
ncbi:hypothetical protein Tco_0554599, partial [Tanacetum coccineum]